MILCFNSCHEAKGVGLYNNYQHQEFVKVDSVLYKGLDHHIEENITKFGCPGMAVAIIKDNQIIFEKEYGVRSMNGYDPIDKNTVFRLGSVSKGFAGILASILIDKKMLSLDDPIYFYVPDFKVKARNSDGIVRIKHVLSHTSGFTEHAFSNLVDKNVDREKLFQYLERITPRDSTGKAYAYQNVAFSLIEKAIEQVTGMTYGEALDFYIFSPLDMCSSSCSYEEMENYTNRCQGHNYSRDGFTPQEIGKHYYNIPSAGGVNAPLKDMEKWLSAVMGNKPDVLSPNILDVAFSEYANTSLDRKFWNKWPGVQNSHYGLGWRLVSTTNNNLVYHGGLVNGFRTEIAFDKEKKIGIVVLFNSLCNYSNSVVFDFFDFWNTYNAVDQEIYL